MRNININKDWMIYVAEERRGEYGGEENFIWHFAYSI